jgi:spore coat polysaccharide biosynthesis protein SpsF
MQPLAGRPMLDRVLRRAQRARTLDIVILATTEGAIDDPIVEAGRNLGVPVFRGPEQDVLRRYLGAAEEHHLDVVVRLTADCPLIDPAVIDLVVAHFLAQPILPDYGSNTWPRSVPTGLDTEVFTLAALRRADLESTAKRDREHVTLWMKEHPETFRISPVAVTTQALDARWTVDEPADLEFVRALFEAFGGRDDFHWGEVKALLDRRPELSLINAQVRQRVP